MIALLSLDGGRLALVRQNFHGPSALSGMAVFTSGSVRPSRTSTIWRPIGTSSIRLWPRTLERQHHTGGRLLHPASRPNSARRNWASVSRALSFSRRSARRRRKSSRPASRVTLSHPLALPSRVQQGRPQRQLLRPLRRRSMEPLRPGETNPQRKLDRKGR